MKTTNLKIEGMTCGGCVASVKRALQAVPGVNEVEVTLTPGQAIVSFAEEQVGEQELRQAVEDAGFDVP